MVGRVASGGGKGVDERYNSLSLAALSRDAPGRPGRVSSRQRSEPGAGQLEDLSDKRGVFRGRQPQESEREVDDGYW